MNKLNLEIGHGKNNTGKGSAVAGTRARNCSVPLTCHVRIADASRCPMLCTAALSSAQRANYLARLASPATTVHAHCVRSEDSSVTDCRMGTAPGMGHCASTANHSESIEFSCGNSVQ